MDESLNASAAWHDPEGEIYPIFSRGEDLEVYIRGEDGELERGKVRGVNLQAVPGAISDRNGTVWLEKNGVSNAKFKKSY